MSKPKFTPGPWRYSTPGCEDMDTKIWLDNNRMIGEVRGWGWLEKAHGNQAIAVQTANGQLMAAAPELYEALERMTRLLRENYQLDDLAEQVIAKAQAALKKARGK